MDVGRKAEGGEALMCLTVDTEVPADVLALRRRQDRGHKQLTAAGLTLSSGVNRLW